MSKDTYTFKYSNQPYYQPSILKYNVVGGPGARSSGSFSQAHVSSTGQLYGPGSLNLGFKKKPNGILITVSRLTGMLVLSYMIIFGFLFGKMLTDEEPASTRTLIIILSVVVGTVLAFAVLLQVIICKKENYSIGQCLAVQ